MYKLRHAELYCSNLTRQREKGKDCRDKVTEEPQPEQKCTREDSENWALRRRVRGWEVQGFSLSSGTWAPAIRMKVGTQGDISRPIWGYFRDLTGSKNTACNMEKEGLEEKNESLMRIDDQQIGKKKRPQVPLLC